jgi:hypothetical protein
MAASRASLAEIRIPRDAVAAAPNAVNRLSYGKKFKPFPLFSFGRRSIVFMDV